jgi:hypothetical protein
MPSSGRLGSQSSPLAPPKNTATLKFLFFLLRKKKNFSVLFCFATMLWHENAVFSAGPVVSILSGEQVRIPRGELIY